MNNPLDNIGKICKSLEKYYDVQAGRIKIKSRPALIIGCEENYESPFNVDYELLPISKLSNTTPDDEYDFLLDEKKIIDLGLESPSYIRSQKTTWNHCKRMKIELPIGDLKNTFPDLFEEILIKNHEWVTKRTNNNITKQIKVNLEEEAKDKIEDLPF